MKVIGYVLKNDKYDRKYYFEATATRIAKFIVQFGLKADQIIITDMMDDFILNTSGYFIDQIENKELLELILDELIPLQKGEYFTPLNFEEVEPGVMELIS